LLVDVKTCIALQILFRYLEDTAASPLRQRFVEQEHPWASFIWSNLQYYARPYFSIVFSGVPYESNSEAADDRNDDITSSNLFEHGIFYQSFMQELQKVVRDGFFGKQNIHDTIQRHRRLLCEELEYDPHEIVMNSIIQDVVAQTFLAGTNPADIPKIGSQANVFKIIDNLMNEDDKYWKTLITTWLIDAPIVEVNYDLLEETPLFLMHYR
jgi:Zn-dependent M16 (insulinase) family peptidase